MLLYLISFRLRIIIINNDNLLPMYFFLKVRYNELLVLPEQMLIVPTKPFPKNMSK